MELKRLVAWVRRSWIREPVLSGPPEGGQTVAWFTQFGGQWYGHGVGFTAGSDRRSVARKLRATFECAISTALVSGRYPPALLDFTIVHAPGAGQFAEQRLSITVDLAGFEERWPRAGAAGRYQMNGLARERFERHVLRVIAA